MGRRALWGTLAVAPAVPAWAQAFPARPVRLVIPFGAGGITDLVARILAERTAAELGATVVAENRAGANGNIAGEYVARSAPDGYTLLMELRARLSQQGTVALGGVGADFTAMINAEVARWGPRLSGVQPG